ncbi:MAG: YdcF family protein [Deltaproteobacteria bacterium]|jgi:uncharacterized SAM-binding protein YcdF (DUF218 family)|nr:YdcF family protein [Deltaproteobacteria bacterium]
MLFFNKLLPIFVLPLAWVVALLVLGIVRKRRWPLVAALAVLYVASMPVVGNGLFRWLESSHPPIPVDAVEPADAIVPLGGIFGPATPEGFLPNLAEGSDRLEAGILLWQKKKAPTLVFTSGRIPWAKQDEVEGARALRFAGARGIPTDRIVLTGEVGNTVDEARAVAALVRERGWRKIILVTSAWHLRRAARTFRKASVDFVPFPVDFQIDRRSPLTLLDFLPRAEGLRFTEAALREWYGIAFYALLGR